MKARTRMACLSAWVAFAGCGGGGGAGDTGDTSGVPPALVSEGNAFISAFAQTWCNDIQACCQTYVPFDMATCLKEAQGEAADYVVLPTAPTTALPHFNASSQATCLQEIQDVATACVAGVAPANPNADQCTRVFSPGGKSAGASCTLDSECAPPADGTAICGSGVCAETTTNLPAGAACGEDVGSCATGLQCDRNKNVCVSLYANGEACLYSTDCAEGLRCLGTACAPLGDVGSSCNLDPDCVAKDYCAPGSTCQARLPIGAACTGNTCVAGAYCSETTHACAAQVSFGQMCPYAPVYNDSPCGAGGNCVHSTLSATSPLVCVPPGFPALCITE